jgi:hypothetical protein
MPSGDINVEFNNISVAIYRKFVPLPIIRAREDGVIWAPQGLCLMKLGSLNS